MPKKWTSLVPPPSPDARVMELIGELNSLVDEYSIVYRGTIYKKESC